jgi:hypothetical protein
MGGCIRTHRLCIPLGVPCKAEIAVLSLVFCLVLLLTTFFFWLPKINLDPLWPQHVIGTIQEREKS